MTFPRLKPAGWKQQQIIFLLPVFCLWNISQCLQTGGLKNIPEMHLSTLGPIHETFADMCVDLHIKAYSGFTKKET